MIAFNLERNKRIPYPVNPDPEKQKPTSRSRKKPNIQNPVKNQSRIFGKTKSSKNRQSRSTKKPKIKIYTFERFLPVLTVRPTTKDFEAAPTRAVFL
jgi:hypothetical protein